MKAITIFPYINLGALHWHLSKLSGTVSARGENGILAAIKTFKQRLEEAGLPVTLRAGWKLWQLADEIEKDEKLEFVPPEMISKICTLAYSLENTLIAESEGKVTYLLTDKRLDIGKLLSKQSALLAPDVWSSLPSVCVYDFSGACKSVAYELPTAAAFHILRCTEGVLRHYYLGVIKQKRLKPDQRTWGAMVSQMRAKRLNTPSVELLDVLDRIRVNFRNPTNHPEKIYDIDEVQDLFGLCIDAINRMVKADQWILPEDSFEKHRREYEQREEKFRPPEPLENRSS
jgi:hypothetical protein